MTNKLYALSWSRISNYRQCPKQFAAKYIDKTYPDESDNPAFAKGTKVHKQLEDYILFLKKEGDEPTTGKIATNVLPIINSYFDKFPAAQIFAEKQISLDHDWASTTWFGSPADVKFRGIMDMLVFESETELTIIDFKTGKVRPYDDDLGQLHMMASFMFELYPYIQVVKAVYLFAEHKKKSAQTFLREDHKKTKASFDIEYIEVNEDTEFEARKNQYCYFCGIKQDCEYG